MTNMPRASFTLVRFLPQLVRISLHAIQQAGKRIVRGRRMVLLGLHPRRLRAGEGAQLAIRKSIEPLSLNFGLLMPP